MLSPFIIHSTCSIMIVSFQMLLCVWLRIHINCFIFFVRSCCHSFMLKCRFQKLRNQFWLFGVVEVLYEPAGWLKFYSHILLLIIQLYDFKFWNNVCVSFSILKIRRILINLFFLISLSANRLCCFKKINSWFLVSSDERSLKTQ